MMGTTGKILLGLATMALGFAAVLWIMWKSLKKSDDPGRLATKFGFTVVLFIILIWGGMQLGGPGSAFAVPIFASVIGVILGIIWAPSIGALVASPLMELYEGGGSSDPKPLYSIAQARRKQGKYRDAQTEVRKQLAQFPNDFEGWMLMAEIFARDLKDMSGSSKCVEQIVSCADHPPRNVSFALTCLADWYLEIDHDRDAAKESLERIEQLFPNSEYSHQSAQRLAHLGSKEMIHQNIERRTIVVKQYDNRMGLQTDPSHIPAAPEEDWNAKAAEIVKHLDDHPLDNEARENLANIYADHYHRCDLAAEQFEQLIGAPNQSPKYILHCLNRLADLYIGLEANEAKARQTLERIIILFPGTGGAATAEKRIQMLGAEMKKNATGHSMQLGVYDQNIGLKGQAPKGYKV